MSPIELKQKAEELLSDADAALEFIDDVPLLPAEVKAYVEKADGFVKAVVAFLEA
jgi:hypothetical protein